MGKARDQRPKPPIDDDVDLTDFKDMPLSVERLWSSDLAVEATGEEFRAAVLLWCKAWHQVPAGSLPADDRKLSYLAGYGRDLDGWAQVRDGALRGFVECRDDRLYHPTICEIAIRVRAKQKNQKKRTEAATAARKQKSTKSKASNRNDDRGGGSGGRRGVGRKVDRGRHRDGGDNSHQEKRREGIDTSSSIVTGCIYPETPSLPRQASARETERPPPGAGRDDRSHGSAGRSEARQRGSPGKPWRAQALGAAKPP